jgi:hypothetical protein
MTGCTAPRTGTSPDLASAANEAEIRRLASCCKMLVQAGDPATAHSLTRHDWYRLHRALELLLV